MNLPVWNLLSARKRKLILWAFGLLVFYTVAGFLILPPIVRSVAVKQISQQLDREASIQSVKINPFALSVSVHGLLIKDKDGEPFVSWDDVYVNFQLSSFFGKAWVFDEITTTKPHVRVVMNKDGSFNFSDIVTKFSTNTALPEPKKESKPLLLHVRRLHIGGATAAVADLTMTKPYERLLGPLDVTLEDFRTDPDNKNPYAFHGTSDNGERYAWSGHFALEPLRSDGEINVNDVFLKKYAPLYQDFVQFQIRDGVIGLHAQYRFQASSTNLTVSVTNTSFALRDFKLAQPGQSNNLVELPLLGVANLSFDLQSHQAKIGTVYIKDANVSITRSHDNSINVVELSKPSHPNPSAHGGIKLLLQSITNAVSMLLESTNQWNGTVGVVCVTNCAVHLEDFANLHPARLDLDEIALDAKNISNIPGTNLTASLSLRWNTNGTIKVATSASFLPPTADVKIDLDQLDLGTLDPYLEPKLNLFVLGSKVNLHGTAHLRTLKDALPEVTFDGDASLNDFRTVDGVFGQDLVKWDAIRFSGIDANLNPPSVSIKEIAVDNAYARLVIETNKTINLLNALSPADTNAPATNETTVAAVAEAQPPENASDNLMPEISIGAIVLTNTALVFSDHSIKPQVNLSIRDVEGSIAGLSTKQLQHADLALDAKVDGVGPVSIEGVINPFDESQTNKIKVAVKNVDLTPASPYAGKFAGYRIAQGKLNLDLDYLIVGRRLESKNIITIDQFNFGEKVNSPDATHLPVRLAVAIMKDRDGKIVLDVPVEGRLDDPKFRVSKVVTHALLNILEKAATSPFSLLGAMFGGGGEELGYQEFVPGSSELTAEDKQKLETIQKALFARPALRLDITGGVDPDGDREGLQRAAINREIRTRIWKTMNNLERATNSVEQLALAPDVRSSWVKKLYEEAVVAGKITPEFIAAHTNLTVLAAAVMPERTKHVKGATLLINPNPVKKTTSENTGYQTKLVPPPDAYEAVLLATIPVTEEDFEALANARATKVRNYLVETGKVDAGRVFLTASDAENLRKDGSRAWLQLQ